MSDDALTKAEAAVKAAEVDTVAVQLALAAVELAKTAAAQQPAPACQHQAQQPFNTRKWVTIGSLVCCCGLVASLFAVAVAVGAVSVAILALVLRAIWRDFQKGG